MSFGKPTLLLGILSLLLSVPTFAADHNDPNAVNSIFSDIGLNAADLYDMFGWPVDGDDDRVVLALTFAPVPEAGTFDTDMLYRVRMYTSPRIVRPLNEASDQDLRSFVRYAKAAAKKYKSKGGMEVRATPQDDGREVRVDFFGFPGGDFGKTLAANENHVVASPGGHEIKVYLGARDDAFFNDLPGFFRSINYAPQFYEVPHGWTSKRELEIPKTLLELEGNDLFNFDPDFPRHGQGEKTKLPDGPLTWNGDDFKRDEDGNFRFVYSGRDAQAGIDINAVILELPLEFITENPSRNRLVNAWGESWVLRASSQVELISDDDKGGLGSWWSRVFGRKSDAKKQLKMYKRVDTDGVPFSDAALSERWDSRQLGARNLKLARWYVQRFGHLGWGFAPSVTALGLPTCFDHGDVKVPTVRHYDLATPAFPRVKKCFFQELNMPDDSWNPDGKRIPLRRPFEIFVPNVNSIDMDTNGTWPFGRRPEDQVATRFLAVFLDHAENCGDKPCDLETLGRQATWDGAPIEPKTPPNPLKNDKPFLDEFPYLAEPHHPPQ